MADFLEEKKREIAARLNELRPAVEEYSRLEGALRALDGVSTTPAPTRARRARGAGAGAPSAAGAGSGRRGRPRGTGTRANQTLELVRAYYKIRENRVRKRIFEMVKAVGAASHAEVLGRRKKR